MRICLVYDCLYPYTVGGGERWYRGLAEGLAARGHEVTYLTLRQWPAGEEPDVPGVRVRAVASGGELYVDGRRSIGLQLRFAAAVLRHLLRHGTGYDVVQTPGLHLALLAVLAARRRGFRVAADWFEVWTRRYWLDYLGPIAGGFGWAGRRLCVRSRHVALCFSRLHAARLAEQGHPGEITLVEGLYAGRPQEPVQVAEPV